MDLLYVHANGGILILMDGRSFELPIFHFRRLGKEKLLAGELSVFKFSVTHCSINDFICLFKIQTLVEERKEYQNWNVCNTKKQS